MKKVVAVVVTYNRKNKLQKCIHYLQQLNGDGCDILIIDNGSDDGTKESLLPYISDGSVFYKNTGENLGGAGGFSYGVKIAVELGYTYLWLMDDDTYVMKNSLEELLKTSRALNGKYGWLSSIALWKDGSLCAMNQQKISLYKKIENFRTGAQKAIMATFVSFFVPSDIVKEFGLPIKEFFIWADDLEYSRRISLKKPCYVVGASRVVHDMGSNNKVGIETDTPDRMWRYEYLYRNEVYIYRREGLKGWIYMVLRVLKHILKVLFQADGNKFQKIKIIVCSFISGLKFNLQIEYVS